MKQTTMPSIASLETLAEIEFWDEDGLVRKSQAAKANGWRISGTENLQLSNETLGIAFEMRLAEKQGRLELLIPKKGIKEKGTARLKSLRPLPGFISSKEGEGASLVLPNDLGSLCHCKGKSQAEYKLPVFFPFPSPCNMALFGIDKGNCKAVSAIVEGGRFDLTLYIRTAWGDKKLYSIDPEFTIRDYRDEAPLDEDISLLFKELSGEVAGWLLIAQDYRAYNLTVRKIPTLAEKIKGNPALTYAAKALTLRCRLCVKQMPTPILEQTPDNLPPMTVFMTFENVRTLLEECARQKIGPTEFCLVGWNYGGHDGAFPQLFPAEKAIGGDEGLKKTIARSHELGYPMSLHDNYFDSYSLANTFDRESINRNHDGSLTLNGEYGGGQAYQVCPKRAYERNALKNLPEVAKLGVKGSYYIDVLSTAQVTKCYHKEHPVSRRENALWWKRIMGKAQGLFGSLCSEGGRDWALPELDRAYQIAPVEEPKQPYMDEEIPLYQAVYHGLLIYNSYRGGINTFPGERVYLKNLAYGGMPLLYYHQIFNPAWNAAGGWDKDLKFGSPEELKTNVAKIKRITDDIAKLAELQTAFIENFTRHSPQLTETRFSNGKSIFTNDSDSPVKLSSGETVPARNFIVI